MFLYVCALCAAFCVMLYSLVHSHYALHWSSECIPFVWLMGIMACAMAILVIGIVELKNAK